MRPGDPAARGDRGAASTSPVPPLPTPRFDHLIHLTDAVGVWEHAAFTTPRVAHGFCTDDNARALIVVSRAADTLAQLDDLAATYLRFVLDARVPGGTFRNRRDKTGTWLDDVGSDDSNGRAWWALGVVASYGREPWMRKEGIEAFDDCAAFESVHLRANAFAALGAAELLATQPRHTEARRLLRRCAELLATAAGNRIPWFEARLTYDNARLPEALLAAGDALGDARLTRIGLRRLTWLMEVETSGDHFSFVPHGGRDATESVPGFDQQPVEAAAMAEACWRAWTITGDDVWRSRGLRAAQWFVGHNDGQVVLYDAATGGTHDGLMRDGANQNQGAESTLAGLAAMQVAAAFGTDEPAEVHP